MNAITRSHFAKIRSADRHEQGAAYSYLIEATRKPVDWAYEVWDELLEALSHKDNRVRSIAAQLLCNLAKSDPRARILKDFGKLLVATKDPQFVTARHTLQALWHIGVVGKKQQARVVTGLSYRFRECAAEKNGSLIRYDILQGLRRLYDAVKDEGIRKQALALIATEEDLKYRRKYAKLWR
jgi:HEAT repeat protein